MRQIPTAAFALALSGSVALAMSNDAVMVTDQDVSSGVVTADKITAEANGWLVVHRTDTQMKPGPVIGTLKKNYKSLF